MEGHKSKGGVGLLELALGKMYHNPLVIYREYIQNACDGLEEAVGSGLIRNDEKNVIIKINRSRHQITFEDGGIGVSVEKIGDTLVDIGNSKKSSELIGQYGIGRLIAAKYCERIIFETTAINEPVMSTLTWETEKAFDMIDSKEESDFTKIIDAVTKHETHKEDPARHYFRVILDNVNDFDLLDEDKIRSFIAQTAPIDFSFEYKDEMMKPALENAEDIFRTLMSKERTYNISLNDVDIRKLYESEVNGVKMTPPQFFFIEDVNYGRMAWGWYSLPLSITEMNDSPFRGIRLRKSNMAIGLESILTEYFPKNVDAFHFVGELYLIHKDIEPSGSRDGIGVSTVAKVFKVELEAKCKELHDLYTKVYRYGNDYLKKISETYVNLNKDKNQLKSEEDKDKKKDLRNQIKQKSEEIQSKIKEMAIKKEELSSIPGSQELIESITSHNDTLLNEKIEKHNLTKGKDRKSQIKKVTISQIAEDFKKDDSQEEETVSKEVDPLASLPKHTRAIIDVVKKVIESESTLTDSIKDRLMKNILRKVPKK